jgi:23S rRNA (guanosine2251-2'-O)-methyltransferase
MAIAKVANISNTILSLKEKGVWVFAAEAGGTPYYETNFKGPCAIVLGSEGNGVSQIVVENSDALTSIPMNGKVNSFNVSTAASVILCEVARQNRTK